MRGQDLHGCEAPWSGDLLWGQGDEKGMTRSESLRLSEAMRRLGAEDRSRVVHVIPDGHRWVVKRERARRATRILSSLGDAIELARSSPES